MTKKLSRKELLKGEDPVEHTIQEAIEWVQENFEKLLLVVGGILIVILGVVVFRIYRMNANNEVASALFQARLSYETAMVGQDLTAPQQGPEGQPLDNSLSAEEIRAEYAEAKEQFQEILANYEGRREYEQALFLAAKSAYKLGQTDEARDLLKRYRSEYPDGTYSFGAAMLDAALEEAAGGVDAARAVLNNFAASNQGHPGVAQAWMEMGRMSEAKGDYEGAKQVYQQVMDLGEDTPYYSQAQTKRNEAFTALGQDVPEE